MKCHAKVFGQDFDLTLDTKRLYAECLFRHRRLEECAKLYREILRSLDRNEAKEKAEKELLKLQASGAAPPAVLSELELLNKSMRFKVGYHSDKNLSDEVTGLSESKSQEMSQNQSIKDRDPVALAPASASASASTVSIKSPANPTLESTKEITPFRQYKYNIMVAYSECLVAQELFREAETTYNVLIELSGQVPLHLSRITALNCLPFDQPSIIHSRVSPLHYLPLMSTALSPLVYQRSIIHSRTSPPNYLPSTSLLTAQRSRTSKYLECHENIGMVKSEIRKIWRS